MTLRIRLEIPLQMKRPKVYTSLDFQFFGFGTHREPVRGRNAGDLIYLLFATIRPEKGMCSSMASIAQSFVRKG